MVKKIAWHTTFGNIEVCEPVFIRPKQQFWPFSTTAGIHCRGYSLPLQRVIVDFGADSAFGYVPKKLQEHYGIELPVSTIRKLTEHHVHQMFEQEKQYLSNCKDQLDYKTVLENDLLIGSREK